MSIFVRRGFRSLRITDFQLYVFIPKNNEPVAQHASTRVICSWCRFMDSTADAVAFLPDYQHSAGAEVEHAYCCYTDKNIHHFEDDIAREPGVVAVTVKITREAKP